MFFKSLRAVGKCHSEPHPGQIRVTSSDRTKVTQRGGLLCFWPVICQEPPDASKLKVKKYSRDSSVQGEVVLGVGTVLQGSLEQGFFFAQPVCMCRIILGGENDFQLGCFSLKRHLSSSVPEREPQKHFAYSIHSHWWNVPGPVSLGEAGSSGRWACLWNRREREMGGS